jgi:hypothetical protein
MKKLDWKSLAIGVLLTTMVSPALSQTLSGTVKMWGPEIDDRSSSDSLYTKELFSEAEKLKDVIKLSAGSTFLLALHSDGTVSSLGKMYFHDFNKHVDSKEFLPVGLNNVRGWHS